MKNKWSFNTMFLDTTMMENTVRKYNKLTDGITPLDEQKL